MFLSARRYHLVPDFAYLQLLRPGDADAPAAQHSAGSAPGGEISGGHQSEGHRCVWSWQFDFPGSILD